RGANRSKLAAHLGGRIGFRIPHFELTLSSAREDQQDRFRLAEADECVIRRPRRVCARQRETQAEEAAETQPFAPSESITSDETQHADSPPQARTTSALNHPPGTLSSMRFAKLLAFRETQAAATVTSPVWDRAASKIDLDERAWEILPT